MRSLIQLAFVSALCCGTLFCDSFYATNQNSDLPGGGSSRISAYNLQTNAFLDNLVPATAFTLAEIPVAAARSIANGPYDGLLYITTQYSGLPTTGVAATLFASNIGSNNLCGLAVGNGKLYIAEYNGEDISETSAEAVNLGPYISGLMDPSSIVATLVLVPEPSTWSVIAFAPLLVPLFIRRLRSA